MSPRGNRLRWGLLSTARINRRLIPAIRAAARAELAGVASRDAARAAAYAAEWEIPRAYGSYEELLADPGIDAVYISLPNHLHAEWAVRAALAGKQVLCEKPLALSVAECDRIAAAAQAAGVVVLEAVMYRYHPLTHRARRLVEEGAVGQLRLVRGAFSFFLDRPDDVRWRPEWGGGALWDIGSYPVSLIRYLAGEPDRVFGWASWGESGIDETFAGLLRCPQGVLGAFDCGFRGEFRTQAEVVGSEGALAITDPYLLSPKSRLLLRTGSKERVVGRGDSDSYRHEVEALTAAALDGTPPPVPLSSSRANVAALAALYGSARRGEAVSVGGD